MGMQFRVEKDFLGEKQLPAEAYYGINTVRAVENFPISGVPIHAELISALGEVKKAAALANMELGFLPKRSAKPLWKQQMKLSQAISVRNSSWIRFKAEQAPRLI